jgi:hypothetical protein
MKKSPGKSTFLDALTRWNPWPGNVAMSFRCRECEFNSTLLRMFGNSSWLWICNKSPTVIVHGIDLLLVGNPFIFILENIPRR